MQMWKGEYFFILPNRNTASGSFPFKKKTACDRVQQRAAVTDDRTSLTTARSGAGYLYVVLKVLLILHHNEAKHRPLETRRCRGRSSVCGFSTFPTFAPLARSGSGRHAALPPGRTFLSGEVGVVTWLVGLVGGDTVMLVEVAVVLLLTDAEGLLLSAGDEKMHKN